MAVTAGRRAARTGGTPRPGHASTFRLGPASRNWLGCPATTDHSACRQRRNPVRIRSGAATVTTRVGARYFGPAKTERA
ncbi:hypothetical protein HMPREF9154_0399 [Arachnia propionica F0230a]|nr:hypothetical protein HMPREF9154_0399 [Arachnia propionica F0230a]